MSLKKFNPQDIITNTMRTHPTCEFFVTEGQIYYNNIPAGSGTLSVGANVPVTSGYASLYEMNVDRLSGSTNRFIGGKAESNEPYEYTLIDPDDGRDPIWVTGPEAVPGGTSTHGQWAYSQTAAAGLQGWWELSSKDGLSVPDVTGDHDGTAAAGMGTVNVDGTPVQVFQPSHRAMEFDGDQDYINVGTAATWDDIIGADTGAGSTQLMTFAMWVQYHGTGDSYYPRLFHFGNYGNADGDGRVYAYVGTAGALRFSAMWSGNRGTWKTAADTFSLTDWTHVVITYDATSVDNLPVFYINGVRVEIDSEVYDPSGTYSGIDTDDCRFGNRGIDAAAATQDRGWQGLMAQASVWNVILTSEDVRALYEAKSGDYYTTYGGYIHSAIIDNGLIYPYVTKDGTRVSLSSVTTGSSYDLDFQYGDVVSGSYPLSASIKRELIGWYPAANGADAAADGGGTPNGWLTANGPYNRDESGGSRGAGQRDTGYSYLLPDNVSLTTEDVDSTLPAGTLYDAQQCGNSDTWIDADFEQTDVRPSGMACNSPKWPHYWALKNTLNNYRSLSPHYAVTGSTSAYQSPAWIKDQQMINMISIPSIFYGSKIKPGSVSLKWYLTGTLIGELQDTKQNGELMEITTSNPYIEQYGPDRVAGVVLYKEGFILLTGSWALNEAKGTWNPDAKTYTGGMITIRSGSGNTPYSPMWIDWGAGANDNCNKLTTSVSGSTEASPTTPAAAAANNLESASFGLSFKGTSDTQVLTMFAHARRGEANFSNNPTYLSHSLSLTSSITTSSYAYVENPNQLVYSFVSSSAMDHSASYKREVYISRVGIYDENKNLIGVATVSNPIRKEEEQDLTFKLKLDI